MTRTVHTIDASNQVPGRLASRVARLLMGKHKVTYQPQRDDGDVVLIQNVYALKLNKKKMASRVYYRHTQHPGGLRTTLAKDYTPQRILHKAIYNMLPKNKLRARMLKRLTIQ